MKFTPELKAPSVAMPFGGDYTQADYAQQLIDEYKTAGVDPKDVFVQSLNDDVRYWIEHEPEFGEQAIYLDDRYEEWGFDHADPSTWSPTMAELAAAGINIIAPPIWMLVELSHDQEIILEVRARRQGGGSRHHHLDARALWFPGRRRLVLSDD